MRLLRKLLNNLGDVWNKLPKDEPYLTIAKGAGLHTMLTIDEGMLFLHSVPYRRDMPQRQMIVLDGMNTTDVINTLADMGYTATPTSELVADGVNSRKPYVMMEVTNVRIDGAPYTATAFKSKLWSQLYPIYRVLRQAEYDTEQALKQLDRTMADGSWLDFWASFFSIEREPNETDNNFVRRFTMWLFNPKTNNIAIKELLSYRLQDTNISVSDVAPLQFALEVSTKYLQADTAAALHKILRETKGAGIEYFLNYMADPQFEDYRAWLADQTGLPFSSLDKLSPQLQKTATDTAPTPVDVSSGTPMRTDAEAVPVPSEAPGGTITRSLAEGIAAAVEAKGGVIQRSSEDGYIVAPTAPLASDSFARPDGPIGNLDSGGAWLADGTSTIPPLVVQGGVAQPYFNGSVYSAGMSWATFGGGSAYKISYTLANANTDHSAYATFRQKDASNYYAVELNYVAGRGGSKSFRLTKYVGGVQTILVNGPIPPELTSIPPQTFVLTIEQTVSGRIIVSVGGIVYIDYTDATDVSVKAAGFRVFNTGLVSLVSFSVVPGPPDAVGEQMQVSASEAYTIPVDSLIGAFGFNGSQLNNDSLVDAGNVVQQDRAVATLTVGGSVVLTRPL